MRESFIRSLLGFSAAVLLAAPPAVAQNDQPKHEHMSGMPTATAGEGTAPLYQDLGTLHHPISARSELAQDYFDQGLRLAYAFNHEEAIASYTEATRADSTCAMCYWGIGYALGPNINAPMDTSAYRPAYAAIQRAVTLSAAAKPVERALIMAAAKRYGPEPVANRAPLDSAYAAAMKAVAKRYPWDLDVQTLYVESLLDLSPWNYWTDRGAKARPGTQDMVVTLERVLKRNPNHPGACHLYIHVVEASTTPGRALSCADRLAKLMPGAGHLVHMPSHIYMRVGRYDLVAEHNHEAVGEDESFIQDRKPAGFYKYTYYPHNYHMLWAGLLQLGRGAEAIAASRKLAKVVPVDVVAQVPPLEYFFPAQYWSLVRFGRDDEMLAEPAPAPQLRYTRGMWHYGRGLAATAKGRLELAASERDSLAAITEATAAEAPAGINSQKKLLTLAERHLAGRIALAKSDTAGALAAFQEAIRTEDELVYDEPPAWYHPIRQELAAVHLAAGRPAQAEKLYREDLVHFPNNGWSLYGLARSLEAQGKKTQAAEIDARYQKAWSKADTKPLAEN